MPKNFAETNEPAERTTKGGTLVGSNPILASGRLPKRENPHKVAESNELGIQSGPVRRQARDPEPPGLGPRRHPWLLAFRGQWHVDNGELYPALTEFQLIAGINSVTVARDRTSPTGVRINATNLVERLVDEEGGIVIPPEEVCEFIGRYEGDPRGLADSSTGAKFHEGDPMYRTKIRGAADLRTAVRRWQERGMLPTEPTHAELRNTHIQMQGRLAVTMRTPALTDGEQIQRDALVRDSEMVRVKYTELCEAAGVAP